MCKAGEHDEGLRLRRNFSRDKLENLAQKVGEVLKGRGRQHRDKGVQADMGPTLQSRMLLPSLAMLACCLLMNQVRAAAAKKNAARCCCGGACSLLQLLASLQLR